MDFLTSLPRFQSTPSAWRETWPPHMCRVVLPYFNPLPPHGGRPEKFKEIYDTRVALFQSTPSAWRETTYISPRENFSQSFQSTPSAWRETGWGADMAAETQIISIHSLRMEGDQRLGKSPEPRNISIHSLRMEGDNRRQQPQAKASHFNPLPPHGGRLDKITEQDYADLFQSTPSAWRETILTLGICAAACISIHSLRMEGDKTNCQ